MDNEAAAADEPALLGVQARPPMQQLGFFLPLLRGPRFSTAVLMAVWGGAGLLSSTFPNLNANPDHVMLHFLFLMAGLLLLLLSIAAPDLPWAETAAARLEGWIRRAMF